MANLTLLDPFLTLIDYPSTLIASLRSGHSTCTRFSPCGSFLASGRVDGCVVVYDVETMGKLFPLPTLLATYFCRASSHSLRRFAFVRSLPLATRANSSCRRGKEVPRTSWTSRRRVMVRRLKIPRVNSTRLGRVGLGSRETRGRGGVV